MEYASLYEFWDLLGLSSWQPDRQLFLEVSSEIMQKSMFLKGETYRVVVCSVQSHAFWPTFA